jgi:hypothetical protein
MLYVKYSFLFSLYNFSLDLLKYEAKDSQLAKFSSSAINELYRRLLARTAMTLVAVVEGKVRP